MSSQSTADLVLASAIPESSRRRLVVPSHLEKIWLQKKRMEISEMGGNLHSFFRRTIYALKLCSMWKYYARSVEPCQALFPGDFNRLRFLDDIHRLTCPLIRC